MGFDTHQIHNPARQFGCIPPQFQAAMGSSKRKLVDDAPRQSSPKQHRANARANVEDEPVACVHDVSYPEGSFNPLPSSSISSTGEKLEPAKVFPFSLDPFQSEAIKCLETGESVMVT